ncbi:MAG: M20/M25/M40 family metallo-hydrolase [Candidatus Delongbacteria bacterium]|nr:M20/M25/M40 family metallo-hydrolase [Candidatus Delongbacteria bacterium]
MNKSSKNFLFELLNTPSPSGMEKDIQLKWMKYVKKYADKVETDIAGNAIAIINPKAKFKILLAGHCDEIGFIINRIDDNGYLYFSNVGGISSKIAPGMQIEVLGYKKNIIGVIGANAEHHGGLKDKFDFEDLYIDCGANSKKEMSKMVQIGDFAVYKVDPLDLLNGRLSGRGLDDKTGSFIIAEVIRKLSSKKVKVGVYSVSTTSEEIGLQGAYSAASGINPDIAIACDVTFATDYPGVNTSKYGEYDLEGGPVLAKGSPINRKVNELLEKAAKKLKIKVQYELTPDRTGTDADRMRYTGTGVPVALVSLPLRYMHSPVETVSYKDIDEEIDLLVEMIVQLTGKENLKPLEN